MNMHGFVHAVLAAATPNSLYRNVGAVQGSWKAWMDSQEHSFSLEPFQLAKGKATKGP